jgi:hypothetical protein
VGGRTLNGRGLPNEVVLIEDLVAELDAPLADEESRPGDQPG